MLFRSETRRHCSLARIEFVLRHGDTSFLMLGVVNQTWYEHRLLDVYVLAHSVLLTSLITGSYLVWKLYRCASYGKGKRPKRTITSTVASASANASANVSKPTLKPEKKNGEAARTLLAKAKVRAEAKAKEAKEKLR